MLSVHPASVSLSLYYSFLPWMSLVGPRQLHLILTIATSTVIHHLVIHITITIAHGPLPQRLPRVEEVRRHPCSRRDRRIGHILTARCRVCPIKARRRWTRMRSVGPFRSSKTREGIERGHQEEVPVGKGSACMATGQSWLMLLHLRDTKGRSERRRAETQSRRDGDHTVCPSSRLDVLTLTVLSSSGRTPSKPWFRSVANQSWNEQIHPESRRTGFASQFQSAARRWLSRHAVQGQEADAARRAPLPTKYVPPNAHALGGLSRNMLSVLMTIAQHYSRRGQSHLLDSAPVRDL